MKTIQLYCITLLFAMPVFVKAQTDSTALKLPNEVANTYFFKESFFLNSINTSNIYLSGIRNYSKVDLGYGYEEGDYKKVYDPSKNSAISFNTAGIKSYKKLHFLGTFSYNRQISKDIDWSLMMDTDRDNPYIISDSIGGDWIKDRYSLGLKVGSEKYWNILHFGLNLNYSVGLGGRDNDPRPKSTLKNIFISPSVSISLGSNSKLGLSYIYSDYKQDIDVMIKSGIGSAYFYKIMGLELKGNALNKSSYDYRIEAYKNGVSLFYTTSTNSIDLIAEGSYILSTEKDIYAPEALITDEETKKVHINPTTDARFSEEQYDLSIGFDFKNCKTPQKFKVDFGYDDGSIYDYATNQVMYDREKVNLSIKYMALLNASNIFKSTNILIGADYSSEDATQSLYANRKMETLTSNIKAIQAFKILGQEFNGEISIKGKFNLSKDFTIDPKSIFINPETDVTNPVIWSNYYFDSAEWINPSIALTYYPSLSKKFRTFLGASWSSIILRNDDYYKDGTRNFSQVKFGFLF